MSHNTRALSRPIMAAEMTFMLAATAACATEQLGQIVDSETVFVMGFNGETTSVAELADNPAWRDLPAFVGGNAYDLPYWAVRHDYNEALAILDIVQTEFPR